jgi:hypothetical protein
MYEVWWAGLVMKPTCLEPCTWWRKMPALRRQQRDAGALDVLEGEPFGIAQHQSSEQQSEQGRGGSHRIDDADVGVGQPEGERQESEGLQDPGGREQPQ